MADKNELLKITKEFKKYKVPISNEKMEEFCLPKKFTLQPQQKLLPELLTSKLSPWTTNSNIRGILVYHQIGAGKTCTAISIAEEFKKKLNIVVVLPAALIGSFVNELRSECPGDEYITEDERQKLKETKIGDSLYIKIIKKSDERIEKYYTIYSYHKFVALINDQKIKKLNNTLLIIDEVQNMISMNGSFYKALKQVIDNSENNLKIILLSATPMFDTPMEIALTLNLLKPKILFPIGDNFEGTFLTKFGNYYESRNIDLFKSMSKNLVSYYSGDLPISYPKKIFKTVNCEMSDYQLSNYIIARKKENKFKKNFKASMNFPKTFLLGSRMVSNIAFPNGLSGKDGFKSLNEGGLSNIKEYSIKFYKIFQNILESDGPTFVYSTFLDTGGLKSFIIYLEYKGYKNFEKHGIGEKRFAVYSGDETLDKREKIKFFYNQKENQSGKLIKMLLGSPSTKEGISLFRVKQVHVMEPHWNLSRIKQIIGRAIRFCSHKDLPENERYVNVYLYLATHTSLKQSIDEYIWSLAKHKNKLIEQFEHALKENAIDCELFHNRNNYKTDEKQLKCDIKN